MQLGSRASLILFIACLTGAAFALACGDASGPDDGPLPVVLEVAGDLPSDTVQTLLPAPIHITLTDARGLPIPNAQLNIFVTPSKGTSEADAPLLLLGTSETAQRTYSLPNATTDSNGRLSLWVEYGLVAGETRLMITYNDTSGTNASVRYSRSVTILPGAPAKLRFSPADSTSYAGQPYPLTVQAFDRWDNPTPAAPTLSTSRPEIIKVDENGAVTTVAVGRAYVIGTAGGARDSAAISVVPHASLVAFRLGTTSDGSSTFYAFDLDGSNYRAVGGGMPLFNHRSAYYLPDGDHVVLNGLVEGAGVELFTMDTEGDLQTLLAPSGTVQGASYPQPSRDGTWVYFTATTGDQATAIWRVRADGTGAEEVGLAAQYEPLYTQPSPSPDGGKIAVAVTMYQTADGSLGVFDLSTGSLRIIPGVAGRPRWSPVADEIAYFGAGGIRVVGSDGTLLLGPISPHQRPDDRFDSGDGQIDWSPDGKWLVSCATDGYAGHRYLVLIRRADGEVLPLEHTKSRNLCGATWHP